MLSASMFATFLYQDEEYDLSHLDPFEWVYTAPKSKKRPERTYKLKVIFSLHTFTRGLRNESCRDLRYRDDRECRIFDFLRYELSKQLKGIVCTLGDRRCYHTHHGNFFTIELVGQGEKLDYEIYFKVSRSSTKGWLNLYVQSAYVRGSEYQSSQPRKRKIGFQVIAYNVQNKKAINPRQ